jgi:anti-anti-sigma factor
MTGDAVHQSEQFIAPVVHICPTVEGSTTTVAIMGDLDIATADLVKRHILHALSHPPPTRLILDLNQVTFIGSSGLSLLLATRAMAHAVGTALILRGASRRLIQRPLQITGLIDLFVVE